MSAIIQNYQWCSSNEYFEVHLQSSDKKRYYKVTYAAHNPGEYGMNWHCECRGFYYHRKCQHTKKAETMRCGFGAMAAAGSPEPEIQGETECPRCFSDASTVRVAV